MNDIATFNVTANDSACGEPVSCNDITIITPANHMTVTVDPIMGNITCIPEPGFVGLDSLKYQITCTAIANKNAGPSEQMMMTAEAWVHVNVLPAPGACLVGSTTICPGGSAVILATLSGTPPFSFVLSNGTSTLIYTNINTNIYPISVSPTVNTTYTLLTVTDATGALVVGLAVIRLSSGQYKAIATDSGYNTTTFNIPVTPPSSTNTFQSKRGLWREFEAY